MKRITSGLALLGTVLLTGSLGAAEPEDTLVRASAALEASKPAEAIRELESAADQGYVDAALSFDRGLAYAMRVRLGPESDGDLGRAIHGFEEARELSRDALLQAEARHALTLLRSEVARRRARAGEPIDVEEGLSVGRSMARLLEEDTWFSIAILASLLFTVGLVLRGWRGTERLRASSLVVCALSLPSCLVATGFALARRSERLELHEAIIVLPGARPADGRHIVIASSGPLPEGARLRVFESQGGYRRFRRGDLDAWLPEGAVLPLAKP